MTVAPSLAALFNPRNVVLVGASDRPGHWSPRVWGNLKRLGFKGNVFAVNPGRAEIFGARCYPSLAALPEPPDHLALFVPGDVTLDMLEMGAALGARSATLFAAGFGEGGDSVGAARAVRLREIVARTGVAAAGPNCMGLACGRSGFVTLADETLQPLARGPVAVITQSGMLASTFSRALNDRALGVSHLISCGNQTALTLADYIAHLAGDDGVKVILCYIEMLPDASAFLDACRLAHANGKRVVCVKIGGSDEARAAALAHTGAMVGTTDAFDAVAADAGVIRVSSLEQTIEAAELFSRAPVLKGRRVAFIANSGALRTLITEGAERHGVTLAAVTAAAASGIAKALGAEQEASNPLDTKRTLPTDTYMACVDAVGRSDACDLLVMLEELPREAGVARKVANLTALDAWAGHHGDEHGDEVGDGRAAVAVLSPLAFADTGPMRELRGKLPHLPLLRGLDTVLSLLARLPDTAATRTSPLEKLRPPPQRRDALALARTLEGPTPLSEPQSKVLLAVYGIRSPREEVVATPEAVVAAAGRIGYPVVLKAVAADITHKSDAGLVITGLSDNRAVQSAAATIVTRARAVGARLDGILVAEQISGGVEMVLGMSRDPEMGPVLMVGLGGVWLEVIGDVAFVPTDVDREGALAAIARTKASKLLAGYRGAPAGDVGALADAMVALGQLVRDLGDAVHSIDINPIVVLPAGEGAVALDALVVLQPTGGTTT